MNFSFRNIVAVLFAFAVILSACGDKNATKGNGKVEYAPAPEWINQRPSASGYYIGIGSCSKTAQPLDYQSIAKKNALNDLASEISVRVQGSTFLNTLEVNKAFNEEFISNINTTTDEQIEDFEVAGTWENATEYWVYYRLNKAQFQAAKRAKKEQAMSAAYDYMSKAKDAENKADVVTAVDLYLHGLFAMKNYWNEVNEFQAETGKVFIENEIYTSLQRLITGLRIDVGTSKVVLAAENSYRYNGNVRVTYNNQPVKGISVNYSFPKNKYMKPVVQITDELGQVGIIVSDVTSTDKAPSLSVKINTDNMQPSDLDKNLTAGIMKNLKAESKNIPIEILYPSFSIVSEEKMYGTIGTGTVLASGMQAKLVERGMRIAPAGKSDYQVKIFSNTTDGGTSQGFTVAYLELTVNVFNSQGEVVYSESVNNIKGLQLNKDAAGQDAYKKGRSRIEEQMVSSILEVIF